MGKKYKQLSLDERCEIYRLRADGKSRRFIGNSLGRDHTTIGRELKRNSGEKVGYKVEWAMTRMRARKRRKLYKLQCSSALREQTFDLLAMGWSPEAAAGRLELEHGKPVISPESIYRYIYWRLNSHKENLHRCLPRAKFKRGHRGRKGGSSARFIKDRKSIHDRPAAVNDRIEPGHWETDLMLFSRAACPGESRGTGRARHLRTHIPLPAHCQATGQRRAGCNRQAGHHARQLHKKETALHDIR